MIDNMNNRSLPLKYLAVAAVMVLVGIIAFVSWHGTHSSKNSFNGGGGNGNGGVTTTIPSRGGYTPTTAAPTTTTIPTTLPVGVIAASPVVNGIHLPDNPANMSLKGTPQWVASQYQQVAQSLSYKWPNANYWITLATPYMSPSLLASSNASAAQPPTQGQTNYWQNVVQYQQGTWVQVLSSMIVEDAGVTPTSCLVAVTYVTGNVAPDGTKAQPNANQTPTTAVFKMAKIGNAWFVNSLPAPQT